MDILGIGIIVLTTVVFTLIGIWYTKGKHFSIEDYLSARGSVNKGVLISTLVASAIGSWVLFSPPEVGVTAGITGIIGYSLGSAFAVMIFAWLGLKLRKIMPKGHALTEFIVHRFGKGMYVMVLLVMIFYMGVYLTAELTGIALAAEMVFGIPIVLTAIIVGLGTMAYTAAGGLKTSVFTDWVQYWFMIPLIALIFTASVVYLGGFGEVFGKVSQSAPRLFDFGYWPGIEYGITLIIAIIGAELFNQANWQRVYAADSERTMIKSFIIGGVVKVGLIKWMSVKVLELTQGNLFATSMVVMWFSAFASAFIDNIPYVATMNPLIIDMAKQLWPNLSGIQLLQHPDLMPLWWSLALGACLGGNGTAIGASANVIVVGMSEKLGKKISFGKFMLYGMPIMVMTVVISTVYVWLRYYVMKI